MQPTVSIIGAGPTGFALATDLERAGIRVLLYSHRDHMRHADAVSRLGLVHVLNVHGALECCTRVRMTSDMAEAVSFSRLLVLAVPSTAQETILAELQQPGSGIDLSHHILLAMPGNLFSLLLDSDPDPDHPAKAMAPHHRPAHVFETNLAPYSCRMTDAGQLLVMGRKSRLSIAHAAGLHRVPGPSPLVSAQEACALVARILPCELQWCANVVEVSLTNINGVFHPPMMLLNAGRIESTAGDFFLYRDGLTRSVANTILAVDCVRLAVGEALGFPLKSVVEVSNECYQQDFADLVDLGRHSAPHSRLRAPPDMGHRNLSEDVPDLLVPWHDLAEKLGIDASALKAVILLAQLTTGQDYERQGQSRLRLSLESLSRRDLIQRLGRPDTVRGRSGLSDPWSFTSANEKPSTGKTVVRSMKRV